MIHTGDGPYRFSAGNGTLITRELIIDRSRMNQNGHHSMPIQPILWPWGRHIKLKMRMPLVLRLPCQPQAATIRDITLWMLPRTKIHSQSTLSSHFCQRATTLLRLQSLRRYMKEHNLSRQHAVSIPTQITNTILNPSLQVTPLLSNLSILMVKK